MKTFDAFVSDWVPPIEGSSLRNLPISPQPIVRMILKAQHSELYSYMWLVLSANVKSEKALT